MKQLYTKNFYKKLLHNQKKNAEAIAATMNQKIIGIDTLEYGRYGGDVHYLSCEQERGCVIGESHTPFSNRVKSPTNYTIRKHRSCLDHGIKKQEYNMDIGVFMGQACRRSSRIR